VQRVEKMVWKQVKRPMFVFNDVFLSILGCLRNVMIEDVGVGFILLGFLVP